MDAGESEVDDDEAAGSLSSPNGQVGLHALNQTASGLTQSCACMVN